MPPNLSTTSHPGPSSTGFPPPASTSSAPTSAPAPSRARGQNARKRVAAADDAAYHAAAGTKRPATDSGGGGDRVKRKRVDFATLPSEALHRYLACFDLIPVLDPSPLSAEDPGPPSSLLKLRTQLPPHGHALRRTSTASPGPTVNATAANRPRRDPGASRRRSSRLVEEERIPAPPPVYSDLGEVDGMLAAVAERHFRELEVKEVDTVAAFMCTVKARSMFKEIGGF
ncbi:hypothetical protein C8Q80DRAFT_1283023 [Daedaleopsis nitida]|nr:hypothetical protein C8Q80DRAFT_1283023 [Daedaleopsis nitida]